jgi:hypothetical protein
VTYVVTIDDEKMHSVSTNPVRTVIRKLAVVTHFFSLIKKRIRNPGKILMRVAIPRRIPERISL